MVADKLATTCELSGEEANVTTSASLLSFNNWKGKCEFYPCGMVKTDNQNSSSGGHKVESEMGTSKQFLWEPVWGEPSPSSPRWISLFLRSSALAALIAASFTTSAAARSAPLLQGPPTIKAGISSTCALVV